MSTRVMLNGNWFWVENNLMDRRDLSSKEKLLYIALSRYANRDGKCYPSYKLLTEVTGFKDIRTTKKYIKLLEEKKLLTIYKVNGKNNIYFLKNIPAKNVPSTSNVSAFSVALPPA